MKQILIILGLFASVTTFAQSPRIKLNQITKDTVKGSVLISSPSDSGMVYSRDFYVAYGADTVLILYGDTLGGVGGGFASVLSDGVTITGDGTTGNELKVDTSLIATLTALKDSLTTVPTKTTPDSVTITGDGSVANPLKVDTFLISTIQGLVDTLTARGYLTANQTITLSGDVTGSGTTAITATVVDDSHNHIISNVDFLQDSLNAKANDSDLANYVTLSGAEMITGAKTFTNTFTQSGGDANFDSGTLFVDESANNVGIGTTSPIGTLNVSTGTAGIDVDVVNQGSGTISFANGSGGTAVPNIVGKSGNNVGLVIKAATPNAPAANVDMIFDVLENDNTDFSTLTTGGFSFSRNGTSLVQILRNGNVGIGTSSPSAKLEVSGKVKIQDLTGTGGNAVYENGGVLGVASDARFKTYVGDIQNGIALINQLKPKYFIDNRNSSFQQLGFYAQEVKSVINEASYLIGNTDYLGINDRAILATTVKAIQEQQEQIETIQTELDAKSLIIETQQSEIDQLKTLITDLTNRLIILENK